ncbi:MAG: CcmD family protein [Bacteroidetes bacterium]|nr:CcmD family protein [Bacteroidota bacterium]
MVRKIIGYSLLLLLSLPATVLAQADDAQKKYTAFDMRNNGKIYVVVTVVLIILIGLLLYVIRVDRKISKLENHN